jgi:hypothetical protein
VATDAVSVAEVAVIEADGQGAVFAFERTRVVDFLGVLGQQKSNFSQPWLRFWYGMRVCL